MYTAIRQRILDHDHDEVSVLRSFADILHWPPSLVPLHLRERKCPPHFPAMTDGKK